MLNIGSMCTGARVVAVSAPRTPPACPRTRPAKPAPPRQHRLLPLPCVAVHLSPPPHPLRPPAQVKHDLAKLQLTSPVCTKEGEKIALSRRVDKHWRLIGWGQIQKGLTLTLT